MNASTHTHTHTHTQILFTVAWSLGLTLGRIEIYDTDILLIRVGYLF